MDPLLRRSGNGTTLPSSSGYKPVDPAYRHTIEIFREGSYLSKELRRLTGGMGRVVCAAAERAVKSDLNQQGFLFASSIVPANHFDYTAHSGAFRAMPFPDPALALHF